jgi:hypothetical protein
MPKGLVMENCGGLFYYGQFVIVVAALFVLVPYLRGKADLISGWTFFLAGVAIFIGIGSIEASVLPMRFPGLDWFRPTKPEVSRFLIATNVFLVSLFLSYYYDPISRALASRSFNKWPPLNTPVMLFVIAGCSAIVVVSQLPGIENIVFVREVLFNVSHKAMVFASMFAFVLWYRNPKNLIWLALFVALFLPSCVLSMVAGAGRRLLLSLLVIPIIGMYYLHARNWRPTRTLLVMAVGVVALFVVELMYSSVRHFDRRGDKLDRTASNVISVISKVGERDWWKRFADEKLWHFSQQVVHYAMITDRFIETGGLGTKPLNTFKFFLVYPIPRAVYKDKPVPLGRYITREYLRRNTSWGTGVAGQSRYEGGPIVAAMFGYFAAFGIRFFVDPLKRQPNNPFLLAMLAAASLQLLAWPRGDLAVMTFETVEAVFFTIGVMIVCRIVYGTQRASRPLHVAPSSPTMLRRVPAR